MALGLGSIAFTGFNADGDDDIAFVALEEIAAGTTIYFSDREWQGTAFNTGEGEVTFTATSAIAAGTVVTIYGYSSAPTSAFGTVAGSSGISASDEIIYAFTGTANAPATFLAAIANNGFAVDGGTLDGTGLAIGSTAIDLAALGGSPDIAVFAGARSGEVALAGYAALVNDVGNWVAQEAAGDQSADGTAPDLPFDTTAFITGSEAAQVVRFAAASRNIAQAEGDAGPVSFSFTVERTGGTEGAVTVSGAFTATGTDAADFGGVSPADFSVTIADGEASATVTITARGDLLIEDDETFRIDINAIVNDAGVATTIDGGGARATGVIENDDVSDQPFGGIRLLDPAASLAGSATTPLPNENVALVRLGAIAGVGDEPVGRAESVVFDAATGRAFTTNAAQNRVDVFQIGADGSLTAAGGIDLNVLSDSGTVNSVAIRNGVLAIAYESETPGQPGRVALFDAATATLVQTIVVGVLPDQLTFSPDGLKLIVANEGEAVSATINPAGSVSVIDLSGGAASAKLLNTIGFAALNGSEDDLRAAGLATFPGQNASADIEPEYVAISPDGTRAYVTLQEVNAVAVIDLTDPTADRPLAILPLGGIDRSLAGNAFDSNDRDGIALANFDVSSVLQPDAIASFAVGGSTYFVTANEGDARVGVSDEVRLSSAGYVLDPTAYPDAATLKSGPLGRLNVISSAGDTDGDGDIDQITTFGGRGISIFRQNADGTIDKVRETGGEFEAIFADQFPGLFNTEDGEETDNRSDNKGPEPEGVTVGEVGGRLFAFVTLERVGGIMTYDVTDPAKASFVGYTPPTGEDFRPEVVTFVSAEDSPTGEALVLSANEESGTLTLYKAVPQTEGADIISGGASADRFNGKGGSDLIAGLAGDDRLLGGAGNDQLAGGDGSDLLAGEAGNDVMIGGAGSDLFFFDNAQAAGRDRIQDFGASDLLITTVALRDSDANGVIDFGRNRVLDLGQGGVAAISSEGGTAVRRLEFDGSFDRDGTVYFVYSRIGSAAGVDEATTLLDLF